MNVTRARWAHGVAAAGTAAIMMFAFAACGGSSHSTGAAGKVTPGRAHCSDPNPNPSGLTFAAIVCVKDQKIVAQADGSRELEVRVKITNKDGSGANGNTFGVRSWDFTVLDSAGHSIEADQAAGCEYQTPIVDSGRPISYGKSLTLPEPLCFSLQTGQQPRQLVWQNDVPTNL